MTLIENFSLACPNCKKKFKAELYSTINITLDPDLLKKIYEGDINNVECPKCHKEFFVEKFVLFHDMEFKTIKEGKPAEISFMFKIESGAWPLFLRRLDSLGYFEEFKKQK